MRPGAAWQAILRVTGSGRLEPRLILVEPWHKRAHQAWRYLSKEDALRDLPGDVAGHVLPPQLVAS